MTLHDETQRMRQAAPLLQAALVALDVRDLAFICFDSSFPVASEFDLGFGSPYGRAGRELLSFVQQLGFNAVQFGPQGQVTADNPSPYDGAVFSRNTLAIALESLVEAGWVSEQDVRQWQTRVPASRAEQVPHREADAAHRALLDQAYLAWLAAEQGGRAMPQTELAQQVSPGPLERHRAEHRAWLVPDALYDCLSTAYGGSFVHWGATPQGQLDQSLWFPPVGGEAATVARQAELEREFEPELRRYAWFQRCAIAQHQSLRGWCDAEGFQLFGDLQIGYSRRDVWHFQSRFMKDYCFGAPPSRTNPEGQPWGYPVLDPDQFFQSDGSLGLAFRLLEERARKQFAEYHRVRVDHPHGLVCPWVYRANTADPARSVQQGARLFSSPDLSDHPELGRYSRVTPAQLDRSQPRHADGWIRWLEPEQIISFSQAFDVLIAASGDPERLICEVLSTQPRELGSVLGRYGLGRFRITQKANVDVATDVYRSENAAPEDWILVGNHDTPTLWQQLASWRASGATEGQARYLAQRLQGPTQSEATVLQRLLASDTELAHAKFADILCSRARHAMICWLDLFGYTQSYNLPGVVAASNWSLRIPPDYAGVYAERVRRGQALCMPKVVAMALRARGIEPELAARLEQLSPIADSIG